MRGHMRKPRCVLLTFVVLILALSCSVPDKDALNTAYDESEVQPCERTLPISEMMLQGVISATQAGRSVPRSQSATPFRVLATLIKSPTIYPRAEARDALALICTLLC